MGATPLGGPSHVRDASRLFSPANVLSVKDCSQGFPQQASGPWRIASPV